MIVEVDVTDDQVAFAAREFIEWQERQAERDKEHKLEKDHKECSACGIMKRHYRDDYICWKCRDKLES